MVADAVGDGLDADAEVGEVSVESGEREVRTRLCTVLADKGDEFGVAIEGGAGDAGVRGDGSDVDRGAGVEELG